MSAATRMGLLFGRTRTVLSVPKSSSSSGRSFHISCTFQQASKTTATPRPNVSSTPKNAKSTTTTTTPLEAQVVRTEQIQSQSEQQQVMDWATYFQYRKTRRNYERVFMVPCALSCTLGAAYYFGQQDFDPTPIFGMDQMLVYAAGTIAAGVLGLATGPVVGNIVFRTVNSKAKPMIDMMDKEFFKHLVKNRADPTANSVRNPIPDFYGEKIKSVSEYRSWLRKQREYRRKSQFYVGVD